MIKNIWEWILTIFGIKTQTKNMDIKRNDEFAEEYKRINEINFNAIFGNKFANYVINDSTFEIDGNNRRAESLNEIAKSFWRKKSKKTISMALGIGGVALIPYVKNKNIYYDLVEQNRITIDSMDGDLITGATVLSEVRDITNLSTTTTYMRWTNYKIENNNIIITQKYTNKEGREIETPIFWSNIQEILPITNVDRVLFGFIKSPVNNRRTDDKYGVPITYGSESTVKEIRECLQQIAREFQLKETFVGADKKLFTGENKLPDRGIYKKINAERKDGSSFWEIFNPDIRDSSFYARLQELYERLEKEIGASSGVLSKPQTQNATATEIKASKYDTFSIVDDMRTNVEDGLNDFFYACNVLSNAFQVSPIGEYELMFDWDYSLIEDATEQFNQMATGIDKGVIKKPELRNWLKPSETMEESEKVVAEIELNNPSVKDLLGSNV